MQTFSAQVDEAEDRFSVYDYVCKVLSFDCSLCINFTPKVRLRLFTILMSFHFR